MIGKFENEEALLKSYGDLEKEFTKKCQELSRVRKELEMRECERQVEVIEDKNEETVVANDAGEEVREALGNEDAEVGSFNDIERDMANGPEIIESSDGVVEDLAVVQDMPSAENLAFDNLLVRAKANDFLISNADAREYARDIAKVLLADKSLMACSDPFTVAYALVLKNKQHENKNEVKKQENLAKLPLKKEDEDIKSKATVSLLSRNIASFSPARVVQKYRTMDDARAELMRRFS